MQETLNHFWLYAPKWQVDKAAPYTLFYRMLVNACLDDYRKIIRRMQAMVRAWDDPSFMEHDAQMPEAEHMRLAHDRAQAVQQMLDRLPKRQRMAVLLCYMEGMSQPQAAEAMGLKLKAFEGLISRARKKIRDDEGIKTWI